MIQSNSKGIINTDGIVQLIENNKTNNINHNKQIKQIKPKQPKQYNRL